MCRDIGCPSPSMTTWSSIAWMRRGRRSVLLPATSPASSMHDGGVVVARARSYALYGGRRGLSVVADRALSGPGELASARLYQLRIMGDRVTRFDADAPRGDDDLGYQGSGNHRRGVLRRVALHASPRGRVQR